MKVKGIVIALVLSCFIPASMFYAYSVQSEAGNLAYKKAMEANDTPALIRELMIRMEGQLEKDRDTYPVLVKELEVYTQQCTDVSGKAVLNLMLAQLYSRYYAGIRWQIADRIPMVGYVPKDMAAWSSNIFVDTVQYYVNQSLKDALLLQRTPVSDFNAILTVGKDSPTLRPTLFDFLSYQGISILENPDLGMQNKELINDLDAIYTRLIAFRKTEDNPKALLLSELSYAEFNRMQARNEAGSLRYKAVLDSLQQQYADTDLTVEIAIARLSESNFMPLTEVQRDSAEAANWTCWTDLVKRYPHYPRIGVLKNQLMFADPSFSVQSTKTVYPGKELNLRLNYRNITDFTVTIYRSSRTPESIYQESAYRREKNATRGKAILTKTYQLKKYPPYESHDTVLTIPMDAIGMYEYEISTNAPKVTRVADVVSVTRLFTALRNLPAPDRDVLVTDWETGSPVAGAKVLYYTQKNYGEPLRLQATVSTDKDGLAKAVSDVQAYRVISGADSALQVSTCYSNNNRIVAAKVDETPELRLFSDRAIYRPGQTIFFKGIAYRYGSDAPRLLTDKKYTVRLRDANNQVITEKVFTTNEFGAFNGSFALPRQTLSGSFSLSADVGFLSFKVEEYKRPTFSITFPPLKEDVSFGDTLQVVGQARTFSGVNLQGAQVTYRMMRQQQYVGRFADGREVQVADGTVSLTDKGTFTVAFCPEKETDIRMAPFACYRYRLIALITDSKGETEEGMCFFAVGDKGLLLSTNLPERLDKDKAALTVSATNLNGVPQDVQGEYTLYEQQGDTLLPATGVAIRIPTTKQVANGAFTSGKPVDTRFMRQLASGRYLLCMQTQDARKRIVTDSVSVVLYSLKDKKPPVLTHTWLLPIVTACVPGEEAAFVFGTSDKKALVLYEIQHDGVIVARNRIVLNDENHTFRLPFNECYGAGVDVSFTFVKDGQLYTENQRITKKEPNRQLSIYPETFRDRLLPGQKETWNFRITNADSLPVLAEVLATMYDASLDKLVYNDWYFNTTRMRPIKTYRFTAGTAFGRTDLYASTQALPQSWAEYQYDRLNWPGNAFFSPDGLTRANTYATQLKSTLTGSVRIGVLMESDVVSKEEAASGAWQAVPAPSAAELPVQLRSNFNETAFFYPALRTNEAGEVILSFEVPESNTTWKLMLLAYTQTLQSGTLTKEAVSQKKLMVQPNLPRFMRQGDKVAISTQISNLFDKEVSGRVRIELFNPSTNEIVVCLTKADRVFTLAAGATGSATWTIAVPNGLDMIGCRIIAETPEAADGEQQLIPILPNELPVTESTSFTVIGSGDKTIQTGWTPLSSTARPFRMTLEYSNNPAWYAVQALPVLTVPENESVLSLFAAYYGNTLAAYIGNANPQVRSMIAQWEKAEGNSETLYANLEKNPELKNILLQETPWVLEAKNETEQKQRLSLLFNLNNTTVQQTAAMNKLIELQYANGGWSWYKNMPASRAITLSVLKGMAQLTHLGAIEFGEKEKTMQLNALRFLDKSIQVDFEEYKKISSARLDGITSEQLEYLFVRSAYRDVPEDGAAREAIRYYTAQAEKNWRKQTLYNKALTARLLYRNGNKKVAQMIITELRKLATQSPELGMYWANNRESLNFFVSPVSVHCQLMDAIAEIAPVPNETEAMKLWLLKQKQTQQWASVPATMDAIFALLQTGANWLNDTGGSTLTWGGNTYDTSAGQAGTGYIQESVSGSAITPNMGTLTIKKTGAAPAWGAVYRQYFEKLNNIKSAGNGLQVEKKLFVEVTTPAGLELHPVTTTRPLKVGDKVTIQLTIQADRTMDYVQLKDLRAGCFEAANQLSGIAYRNGLVFYQSPRDVSENFFFARLPKGTYVIAYTMYVSRAGQYTGGISTIQCLYAPEFVAHTEGDEILVEE